MLALALLVMTAAPDALVGDWSPADRDVVVHVGQVGSRYEGTTTGDGGLVTVLKGLTWDGKTWRGEVWAPKRKEFLPAVVRLESPDTFVLTAGTGLLSRDVVWRRR
jgi:hypothetical protein